MNTELLSITHLSEEQLLATSGGYTVREEYLGGLRKPDFGRLVLENLGRCMILPPNSWIPCP